MDKIEFRTLEGKVIGRAESSFVLKADALINIGGFDYRVLSVSYITGSGAHITSSGAPRALALTALVTLVML